jgi:hypothetical protein
MTARRILVHLSSAILTLALLFVVDRWLSEDRAPKGEREIVVKAKRSLAKKPDAKAVTLGCSTRISAASMADRLELDRALAVDGHMGGCHQVCSWAEARALRAEGRRFDAVFYALNQSLLCESMHSKRTLQHRALVPASDVPSLFALYARSDLRLRYIGRFLGATASGAYEDSGRARRRLASSAPLFAKPTKRGAQWFTAADKKREPWEPICAPGNESAYKIAATRALAEELSGLADDVYLILLPDKMMSKPGDEARWTIFRERMREATDGLPRVHLVDLSLEGPKHPKHFRDGLHLKRSGRKILNDLLHEKIKGAAP